MDPETISLLKCPVCESNDLSYDIFDRSSENRIYSGVVICRACTTWYPIEHGLLELLAGDLAYRDDRARFWATHTDRLRDLGLYADEDGDRTPSRKQQLKQQTHFDQYASTEGQTYSEYETMPFWQAADRIAFAPWRQEIKPGKWLLDVGCAQGRSTFKLMDLDLNIVGFDVSKRLIRQAIKRYEIGNHRAKATFFAADASRIPFVSESFDYVLVYGVLHHLLDPAFTCREIARVLKPGGLYLGQENNRSAFRMFFDLLQRMVPQWHEEAGPEALISGRSLERWFQGTGLQIIWRTRVFLPPHLINLGGEKTGYIILSITDNIGKAIPILRENGGIIITRGLKT